MKEQKTNDDWLDKAYEDIHRQNQETLKNVKENEAVFECSGTFYYTEEKSTVDTHRAIVSFADDFIHVLWTESDEDIIESYIRNLGDKAPSGVFYIEFWSKDEQTSYEYDEWDIITSLNFVIEQYSEFNFEKTLKLFPKMNKCFEKIKYFAKKGWEVAKNDEDLTLFDHILDEIERMEHNIKR